jgi:hypothetical protein
VANRDATTAPDAATSGYRLMMLPVTSARGGSKPCLRRRHGPPGPHNAGSFVAERY